VIPPRFETEQQRQSFELARECLERVDGCQFAVLLTFNPTPEGAWKVEVGAAGSGLTGFPDVVERTLAQAARLVAEGLRRQETDSLEKRAKA
jgi:hypothetical protein